MENEFIDGFQGFAREVKYFFGTWHYPVKLIKECMKPVEKNSGKDIIEATVGIIAVFLAVGLTGAYVAPPMLKTYAPFLLLVPEWMIRVAAFLLLPHLGFRLIGVHEAI